MLKLVEKVITITFMVSFLFVAFTDELIEYISKSKMGYIVFFGIGLYIGFHLCKYAVRKDFNKFQKNKS